MHIRSARLGSKIAQEMRSLASLAPLFALALLLAWILSGGRAFSSFQSPISPPPLAETPPPTEAPAPTATPTPRGSVPTSTLTSPPTEVLVTPAPLPTKAVQMPAVQAARPTAPPTEPPPSRGAISLWPWVLLGLLSLGAIGVGVYLLRREAPTEEE